MSANSFKIKKSVVVDPQAGSVASEKGEIAYNGATDKFEAYNGTADPMVQEAKSAVLTNKTLSGNTATNLVSGAGTLTLNTSGTATVPNATDTLVGKATSDILSNKTIDTAATNVIKVNGNTLAATAGTATVTIPNSTDTLVGKATTDTLTNKSLDSLTTFFTDNVDPTRKVAFDNTGSTGTIAAFTMAPTVNATYTMPAATTTIVGTTTSQTLSNKTHSDPITFAQVATPATPSSGFNKIYPKSDGNFYNLTPAGVESIIGGNSSGAKNYLGIVNNVNGNGNFELGATTGWSLGTTGTLTNAIPTGTPTFGSGASGNLTISAVTSGKLSGNYSLQYQHITNQTVAGNMLASNAFTIDTSDQAKMLSWKFVYSPTVNSENANWSGTSSNSFAVAIWDATNSVWLGNTGNFNLVQGTGVGVASGSFQTGATTASIRFVVYNANATAATTGGGAITLLFDDFSVGPQPYVNAPAMSDEAPFTMVITGSSSNPTKGTATETATWSRLGDKMVIRYRYIQTVAGSAGSGSYRFTIPNGLTIDSSKTSFGSYVDAGDAYILGNSREYSGNVYPATSTSLGINLFDSNTTSADAGSSTASLGNASVRFGFVAIVPISGWSSNSVASSDTDTRVVAATYYVSANPSLTAGNYINYNNKVIDTHAAVTTGTGTSWNFKTPVSGIYSINAHSRDASAAYSALLYVNNATSGTNNSFYYIPAVTGTSSGTIQIQLNAGDLVSIATDTTTQLTTDTKNNFISIFRLSGPAVITASSVVASGAIRSTSATASSGTPLELITDTARFDNTGSLSLSTGRFTAPLTGWYTFSGFVDFSTGATPPTGVGIYYLKNGTGTLYGKQSLVGVLVGSKEFSTPVTATIQMNTGDYVSLWVSSAAQSVTVNGTSNDTAGYYVNRLGGVM